MQLMAHAEPHGKLALAIKHRWKEARFMSSDEHVALTLSEVEHLAGLLADVGPFMHAGKSITSFLSQNHTSDDERLLARGEELLD